MSGGSASGEDGGLMRGLNQIGRRLFNLIGCLVHLFELLG